MSVSVSVSVSVSLSLSLSVSVSLSLSLSSVCVCVSNSVSVSVCLCLVSVSLSLSLSLSVSLSLSCVCVCVSISLSVSVSVCLCLCLCLTKRVRRKASPWLTRDFKLLIIKRDKAKLIAHKQNDSKLWSEYKSLRNQCNREIKNSKKRFYHAKFSDHSSNPKEIWKTINSITGRSQKDPIINEINVDETHCINNQDEIADFLNCHFTNIGPRLAAKLPTATKAFNHFINPASSVFQLTYINPSDVLNLLKNLVTNKSAGLDRIPNKLLKIAADIIAEPLCLLFNISIASGCIPSDWKIAKVFPLHKGNSKTNPNNYRPISILSSISKVMERLVYNQLCSYLTENKLLNKYQSGFRSLHSTATALLDATNQWYFNIDNGLVTSVIFLDLAKAFDTIDHNILLEKLRLCGVNDNSIPWFKAYLTGRQQRCQVNGFLSKGKPISCGVPQGSILGPLLFLIYINDLPCSLNCSKARMFADDTNITVTANCFSDLENMVNNELESIEQWLIANKLSLNVVKTEYLLVCSNHKAAQLTFPLRIRLGDDPIKRVKAAKSLGVYIDEHLSWSNHIDYIAKKISSGIAGLKQIRPFVPTEVLINIFKSLVLPYFDYCDVVWAGLNKGLSDRIDKLYNRAARIITQSDWETRSVDILKMPQWDTLGVRRHQHSAIVMHKIIHNKAPEYLTEVFNPMCDSIVYNLRDSNYNLTLQKPKTESLKKSFSYRGAKLWNSLPNSIKSKQSLEPFSKSLRSLSLQNNISP